MCLNEKYMHTYTHIYMGSTLVTVYVSVCVYIYLYIGTCVFPKGFEVKSFPLRYQNTTFVYTIHSVEVYLYYFKYL